MIKEDQGVSRAAETIDYMSQEGAQRLCDVIEAYWRARGHAVSLVLYKTGFHVAVRSARYDLRSDMHNGWPRQLSGRPVGTKTAA